MATYKVYKQNQTTNDMELIRELDTQEAAEVMRDQDHSISIEVWDNGECIRVY